ncbi:MAG: hypothetical protein Q8S73_01095 [Deltaproteobacteria bacterium]|nr:hypothetical protein [Myxococcales bacterium]MDP3212670.1 hypothetical protein [Deltaproteobacteria bacterium]
MLRATRWILSSLVTLLGLYAYFFVPITGTRTLWDHTRRILATPEAHELGDDIRTAGDRVATKIRSEVIPSVMTGFDAGVRSDAGRARRSR